MGDGIERLLRKHAAFSNLHGFRPHDPHTVKSGERSNSADFRRLKVLP
jgi:hypothetical protein